MKFLQKLSDIEFYYELGGKQEGDLFVSRFSYGSLKDASPIVFHEEVKSFKTFSDMMDYVNSLKEYCLKLGFKKE